MKVGVSTQKERKILSSTELYWIFLVICPPHFVSRGGVSSFHQSSSFCELKPGWGSKHFNYKNSILLYMLRLSHILIGNRVIPRWPGYNTSTGTNYCAEKKHSLMKEVFVLHKDNVNVGPWSQCLHMWDLVTSLPIFQIFKEENKFAIVFPKQKANYRL